MRVLTAFLYFIIMLFALADSESFMKVTLLDRESHIRRIFENSEDLRYFRDIWEDRVLVPQMKDLEYWDYQIEIMTGTQSIRWLYDSRTGLCSYLSKDNMPVYLIRQFDVINNVIKAEPQQKVVWIIEERPVLYWREPWYNRSGWWSGYHDENHDHHVHHDHDTKHKKWDQDEHDSDHHYRTGSDSHHEKKPEETKSTEREYRERKGDDVARWTPVPVYPSKQETEKKREVGRPMAVPETTESQPIKRPSIDPRKLPGIRGMVEN